MGDFTKIHDELDRAHAEAICVDADLATARFILFSDHHRGRRDGADDFVPCEQAYLKALRFYHSEGFSLCLLGDVEEFWENPVFTVMRKYKDVVQAEKAFHSNDRLFRLWGNHDDEWRYRDTIALFFRKWRPRPRIGEAMSINFNEEHANKNILLVHGHQGNLESDRYAWLSKFFVRIFWRNFQRLFNVALSTPATSHELKSAHDQAMLSWARKRDTVIICGHTHETVFMGNDDEEAAYFNTGCCSYSNGEITGIEIADQEIRLIRWRDSEREIIESRPLQEVLS